MGSRPSSRGPPRPKLAAAAGIASGSVSARRTTRMPVGSTSSSAMSTRRSRAGVGRDPHPWSSVPRRRHARLPGQVALRLRPGRPGKLGRMEADATVRVLLVEDEPKLAFAVQTLLELSDNCALVGTAAAGRRPSRCVPSCTPTSSSSTSVSPEPRRDQRSRRDPPRGAGDADHHLQRRRGVAATGEGCRVRLHAPQGRDRRRPDRARRRLITRRRGARSSRAGR